MHQEINEQIITQIIININRINAKYKTIFDFMYVLDHKLHLFKINNFHQDVKRLISVMNLLLLID